MLCCFFFHMDNREVVSEEATWEQEGSSNNEHVLPATLFVSFDAWRELLVPCGLVVIRLSMGIRCKARDRAEEREKAVPPSA